MNAISTHEAALRRPTTIVAACWLLTASALLTLVAAATTGVALASPDGTASLENSIRSTPEALDGELPVESLVSIALATAIGVQAVIAAMTLGVIVWIVVALRSGRAYIRIVLTVLVLLQAVATVSAPSVLTVGNLLLVVAAVALSWARPSSAYIAAVSQSRRERNTPRVPARS